MNVDSVAPALKALHEQRFQLATLSLLSIWIDQMYLLNGMNCLMLCVCFGLTACGGDEPDFESCATIGGKSTCCRTYCNSTSSKCNTSCG